jgi:HK97 family phage prohead protease
MTEMPLRHIPLEISIRETPGSNEPTLVGHSSTYGVKYPIGRNTTESIRSGAFDRSIRERNGVIPIYYQHNWKPERGAHAPIGHAEVRSDETGLHTTASLYTDISPEAAAVHRAALNGALREWSVGFLPTADGIQVRDRNEEITDADLYEASIVVKGAGVTDMLQVRNQGRDGNVLDLIRHSAVRDLIRGSAA